MNNNLLALISLGANKPQFRLNNEGKIPEEYLPSYVDDVIDLIAISDTAPSSCLKGDKYFNTSSKKIFTATSNNTWGSTGKTPEKDKIYVNTADDPATSWRWSGTDLVVIGQDLSNYLAKNNSVAFTPTGDYNPATKKYVDDNTGATAFYIISRQGSSANRIGSNARPILVNLLNEYLKTNIIPRALITLSGSGAYPYLVEISSYQSGSRQAVALMFKGLCFHHSSQTDFNLTSRTIYDGAQITIYVDPTEWTNKVISNVYYASSGDAEYSSINGNGTGFKVFASSSHPASAENVILKNDTIPSANSTYLNQIYWYNAPTTYDPQTGKPLYVPTHLYLCERTGVSNNTYRWVDYIERQAAEASFKQLGLEEYNPGGTYTQGDYIYWKGVIYQANTTIAQAESEFDTSHWDALTYIEYLKIALAA